jgi:hypothetical protein
MLNREKRGRVPGGLQNCNRRTPGDNLCLERR